jgi:hypothetical protein
MFVKELTQAGHTRRFTITRAGTDHGWEGRIEHDSRVLQRTRYTDWHRVERALSAMSDEVSELLRSGWREIVSTGAALTRHSTKR